MRALIIGIDGKIGSALGERLIGLGWDVMGTSRRSERRNKVWYLDLDHLTSIEDMPLCEHLFICAAMTKYEDCRKNPEQARRINVDAPVAITRHFSSSGVHIIFLSTAAVFDGKIPLVPAESPQTPTSEYGRTKSDAEKLLLAEKAPIAILRLSKVLTFDPLFAGWLTSLKAGKPIRAFYDMVMAPIPLDFAVDSAIAIACSREVGIFQASALGDITYFDAARYMAMKVGADPSLVLKDTAESKGIPPGEHPPNVSLDGNRLIHILGRQAMDSYTAIDQAFCQQFQI